MAAAACAGGSNARMLVAILTARVQRATQIPGVGAGASLGRSPDAQGEALSADVYITNVFWHS